MAKVYDTHGQQSHGQQSHGHGHSEQGGAHEDHGSTKLYWLVGVILAIVTAIEVFWPLLGLNHVGMIGGLIALMLLKGAMVVMWFMHLKGDFNIFKFVFLAPLMIAVVFVLGFLYLFAGTHPGIAG